LSGRGSKSTVFSVDVAANGLDGFFLAGGEDYDCLVLDIMLPKLDGYEIVERLRKKGKKTPVIFLTAKDSVDDRVRGLDIGGDDYLVKPFSFSELLARVRALIRRGKDIPMEQLQAGNLRLDMRKHRVELSGKTIELTPKEFTLLQYLLEHAGEVVTSKKMTCS